MEERRELKYFRLMEELREQIMSGAIKPNEKIPSENQLSDTYSVSRQTVRKALSILEQEGLVYAEHGRGTFCSELVRHTKKSRNIAVVTTYLSDYIFPRVINGMEQVFSENGYSIILKNTKNSRQMEARCLEELLQKDIEGLIIEPSKSQIYCRHMHLYKKLEQYEIPYVFIQGCFKQMQDKPAVLMDDYKGGYMITKHLTDLGHTSIIGVFKADDTQGQERHKGYVKALQEAGILYDPDKVIWFHTEDRAIQPYEQMKDIVNGQESFDAVVCYNDQIAIEVIRSLGEMGVQVPEDVSVTGYDNSYMAENSRVKLTTIAHPHEQLGKLAAEMMLRLIQGEKLTKEECRIFIEPELIIRESTKEKK